MLSMFISVEWGHIGTSWAGLFIARLLWNTFFFLLFHLSFLYHNIEGNDLG